MKIRRLNYVVLLFALFTFLFCGKMTVKAEDRSGLTYYVDAEKGMIMNQEGAQKRHGKR